MPQAYPLAGIVLACGLGAGFPGVRFSGCSRAGYCLAAVFVLLNAAGAVGAPPAALVCIALFPPFIPPAVKHFRRRKTQAAPAQPVAHDTDRIEPPVPVTAWSVLTPRERAVSELLIEDKSNLEICAILFISENTVRTHIKNIYHKTDAASRDELKRILREAAPRPPIPADAGNTPV
jgi:DNA-binding CsgD family transcriptional regulator